MTKLHDAVSHALSGDEARARTLWLLALAALLVLDGRTIAAIPIHHDLAWPLYLADRVLGGSRLYVDLVEVHPPLAIWFAAVATLAARLLRVGVDTAHHLLALGSVAASVLVTAALLRRLLPDRPWTRAALLLLQSFLLLPFFGYSIGQEEHLMLSLVWPYFVAVALAARGERSGRLGWLVGAMAAFGFAIKPLYVVVWLGVEGGLLLFNRRAVPWRRPEAIATAAGIALYVASIVAFTPEYLSVARWTAGVYGWYYTDPIGVVVVVPQSFLVLCAVLADRLDRSERLGALRGVVTIALVASTLLVYAQQKGWIYHWYPALALAIYVLAIALVEQLRVGRAAALSARLPAALAASALAAGLLAGGTALLARTRARWDSLDFGPYFLPEMERIVRTYGDGRPIMTLSSIMQPAFPLVTYAGVPFASRFSCLWMLAGVYADQWDRPRGRSFSYHDPARTGTLERYVVESVIEDMQRTRPSLLVVDRVPPSFHLQGFDYLVYFARDARFREILSHYTILGTLDRYLILRRTR